MLVGKRAAVLLVVWSLLASNLLWSSEPLTLLSSLQTLENKVRILEESRLLQNKLSSEQRSEAEKLLNELTELKIALSDSLISLEKATQKVDELTARLTVLTESLEASEIQSSALVSEVSQLSSKVKAQRFVIIALAVVATIEFAGLVVKELRE